LCRAGLPAWYRILCVSWPITRYLSWLFTAPIHMTGSIWALQGSNLTMNKQNSITFGTVIVCYYSMSSMGYFMKKIGFNGMGWVIEWWIRKSESQSNEIVLVFLGEE
jgi:hypothetical protein